MKNKKANILPEHVVNIVMAVFSILILIALGVSIYVLISADKTSWYQAKADLSLIMPLLEELTKEGDSRELLLYNPNGWGISFQDKTENRPLSCAGNKCLCICKYDSTEDKIFANCNNEKTGVCAIINKNMEVIKFDIPLTRGSLEIKGPTTITMTLSGGVITIRKK